MAAPCIAVPLAVRTRLPPYALGYHLPGCRSQRIEDAVQIDIDYPVPVFVRVLEKGFLILIADSGIGEARIDSAVTFDHTCHAALYGGLVCDIADRCRSGWIDRLQLLFRGCILLCVGTPDADVGASRRDRTRKAEANATIAPRDDSNFSREIKSVVCHGKEPSCRFDTSIVRRIYRAGFDSTSEAWRVLLTCCFELFFTSYPGTTSHIQM